MVFRYLGARASDFVDAYQNNQNLRTVSNIAGPYFGLRFIAAPLAGLITGNRDIGHALELAAPSVSALLAAYRARDMPRGKFLAQAAIIGLAGADIGHQLANYSGSSEILTALSNGFYAAKYIYMKTANAAGLDDLVNALSNDGVAGASMSETLFAAFEAVGGFMDSRQNRQGP